jgi:hypothetical protein
MLMALIGLIPGITSLISAITTAAFNAKVSLTQARLGADRDVAVALVQAAAQKEHEDTAKLAIFSGDKLLTMLLILFAIPLVAFEWKVYVWDTMLGLGTTPAVKGDVANWGNTIIYFLFGSPTVMGLGKMWFSRPSAKNE